MTFSLIDSHCHLDFEVFDRDREALWSRCRSQGIHQLVIPGTDPDQWVRARSLCESPHLDWYFAAGMHPWWLDRAGEGWESACRDFLAHPRCVAVGECGLDKHIDTPMSEQEALLEVHLEMARACDKPIILHCVKAHNELIRQLKRHRFSRGGVVHAFSGSADIAQTYWQMGFRLGVGGVITYERARKTRAAVSRVPLEALLLETDAPDMPVSGRQGERNSPEFLPVIAQTLAGLRGCPVEQVARQTTDNTRQLFRI
ncbi:TatD family hydrolase [Marinimicrobium sp. C6131]|uniref:TatD family hydrolase n=1 Tax=Marinimicrobium sp. C6131 TaxID=3022676 RepID=UPI00223D0A9A|nr:TatD family hydrolase [Marinimicrobium sp. C6131]UZJ44296.1 TatD family hydrolase [Marinimicrobium sp. C6131]